MSTGKCFKSLQQGLRRIFAAQFELLFFGAMSKEACICCGGLCCCAVVALGVGVVVIALNFSQPTINVAGTSMAITVDNSTGNPTTQLSVVTTVDVKNPNGWPFSGSISEADATIKSVDGSGDNELDVGTGILPDSLNIGFNSDLTFNLTVTTVPMAQDSPLLQRLLADCGPDSSHQTKLDVTVTNAKVQVSLVKVNLPDLPVPTVSVPCDVELPQVMQGEVRETLDTVLV